MITGVKKKKHIVKNQLSNYWYHQIHNVVNILAWVNGNKKTLDREIDDQCKPKRNLNEHSNFPHTKKKCKNTVTFWG